MPCPLPTRRRLLGALLAAPLFARAAPPPLRPMLAFEAPAGIDPVGWLVSEKLDGVRALWDGETLRFRSGRALAAPDWFTAALPAVALDGELWFGRGRFEALSAAVRRTRPLDAEWRALRYCVFDAPGHGGPFAQRVRHLARIAPPADAGAPWQPVEQAALPDRAALARRLAEVVALGGEGLMLHRADALHVPGRSDALLKLKPRHDADALVLGHVEGRGRHAGRMGALRVRTADGVEFLLGSGFSDAERAAPPPLGAWVSFVHEGRTAQGVPRFARFLRVRPAPGG